jgi:hypothetical protein
MKKIINSCFLCCIASYDTIFRSSNLSNIQSKIRTFWVSNIYKSFFVMLPCVHIEKGTVTIPAFQIGVDQYILQ